MAMNSLECNLCCAEISQHLAIQVDVGCSQSVKALFETVGRECKVPPSIVVNCAGIMGARRYLTDTPEDAFDDVVRVNLKVINFLYI